jgi:hypothetical protein
MTAPSGEASTRHDAMSYTELGAKHRDRVSRACGQASVEVVEDPVVQGSDGLRR